MNSLETTKTGAGRAERGDCQAGRRGWRQSITAAGTWAPGDEPRLSSKAVAIYVCLTDHVPDRIPDSQTLKTALPQSFLSERQLFQSFDQNYRGHSWPLICPNPWAINQSSWLYLQNIPHVTPSMISITWLCFRQWVTLPLVLGTFLPSTISCVTSPRNGQSDLWEIKVRSHHFLL